MSGTSVKLLGSFPRYTVIVQPALFVSFRNEWLLHVVNILISRSMIAYLTCCATISVIPDIPYPWHKPFFFKMAEHRSGSQEITCSNWWPFSHFQMWQRIPHCLGVPVMRYLKVLAVQQHLSKIDLHTHTQKSLEMKLCEIISVDSESNQEFWHKFRFPKNHEYPLRKTCLCFCILISVPS